MIQMHGEALADPSIFPLPLKHKSVDGFNFHQLPFHQRIHLLSDPKVELENQSIDDISGICNNANSSLFQYHSDRELAYVVEWLQHHVTLGASVYIFTSLKRCKVMKHIPLKGYTL